MTGSGASPGPTGPDIDRLAAEEIAADEARSRDWVSPKVSVVPTQIDGETGLPTALPAFLARFGLRGAAAGVIGIVIVLIALFALFRPSDVTPPPSGSGVAVASSSPSPSAASAPSAAPNASTPAGPSGPPGGSSVAETDPRGDAVTDSGAPASFDQVVDIVDVQVSMAPDGSLDVLVSHAAPLPPAQTGISRAVNVFLGMAGQAQSVEGVILAGQVEAFTPLVVFYWQLHDGLLTIGRVDQTTGQSLETAAVIVHRETVGIYTFHIPADEIPDGVDAIGIISYHRPLPTDERRQDIAGPFLLPGS